MGENHILQNLYQSLQPTERNETGALRELLYRDKCSLQSNLNIYVQKKLGSFLSPAAKVTDCLPHLPVNIHPQKIPKAKLLTPCSSEYVVSFTCPCLCY